MADHSPESRPQDALASCELEEVSFASLGDKIRAVLVRVTGATSGPLLLVAHGAGEQKENYLPLAKHLALRGVRCLLLDMHGHGESGGRRYHVRMQEWRADIHAALDFLQSRSDLRDSKIGALGLSSGGTAILEAAVSEPRLSALVALDATVQNTLPLSVTVSMRLLSILGWLKTLVTGQDMRISIMRLLDEVALASDPAINAKLKTDPGKARAFSAFPMPGAAEAFFVNTIKRVHQVKAPTLVIWGEDDQLDPVSTAHTLHAALTCEKRIEIVPGNGHVGHLDRHRERVFDLAADWVLLHCSRPAA